ncbi:MAG TPA: GNAT family N-acetyltransferase [Actinomycetota bacterium]|nr:GNAT family N-acetyltransferase [Actinomycetota bacterium]
MSRIIARARSRGPAEVGRTIASRIASEIWSDATLVMLRRDVGPDVPDRDDLLFRLADVTDAERYARDVGTDSAETFRARLVDPLRCVVVEREGRLVHASWITTGSAWTAELRRNLTPPPGGIYIFESFTRADARGLGIYPFALRNIVALAAAEGLEHAWVAVEDDNAPSLRAVGKAGFEEVFRISYRRRFGVLRIETPTGSASEIAVSFMS